MSKTDVKKCCKIVDVVLDHIRDFWAILLFFADLKARYSWMSFHGGEGRGRGYRGRSIQANKSGEFSG